MIIRQAKADDHKIIADLHIKSWRSAYRGILSEDYLNKKITRERRAKWKKRLSAPGTENLVVFLAEEDGEYLGFISLCLNDHPVWGTLIDNFHVVPDKKNGGIGTQLISEAAKYLMLEAPHSGVYLWCYEQNIAARNYYEKINGELVESGIKTNVDKTESVSLRFAWKSPKFLLESCGK